jgi:hypothetical protein
VCVCVSHCVCGWGWGRGCIVTHLGLYTGRQNILFNFLFFPISRDADEGKQEHYMNKTK